MDGERSTSKPHRGRRRHEGGVSTERGCVLQGGKVRPEGLGESSLNKGQQKTKRSGDCGSSSFKR